MISGVVISCALLAGLFYELAMGKSTVRPGAYRAKEGTMKDPLLWRVLNRFCFWFSQTSLGSVVFGFAMICAQLKREE